jgi:hypothetical protein
MPKFTERTALKEIVKFAKGEYNEKKALVKSTKGEYLILYDMVQSY